MKKFAIILSGAGVFDGSEIHEAVFTMLAIDKLGAKYQIYAPNYDQYHVINHYTSEVMSEHRNMLVESARIARGNIKDLKELSTANYDILIFPGGFGVAKNFSNFALVGSDCEVIPDIERVIKEAHAAKKPIGALCIAPVLLAEVLNTVDVTIGNDEETAKILESMGATHINTKQGEVVIDKANLIVTSPCYMLDSSISQIAEGAENTVRALLDLIL